MSAQSPTVIIIGGPNGAGKSTVAAPLLQDIFHVDHFVNADTIARGLSAFQPAEQAFAAGRVMLERLHELAGERQSFAFETTLSSRSFAPWLSTLRASGYATYLLYIWVSSSDTAVERVAHRVASGGHDVPADVIRRRYDRSLRNLFELYIPLADHWYVYDNSSTQQPGLIAHGQRGDELIVIDARMWREMQEVNQ